MEAKNLNFLNDWWRHCGCYDREQASNIPYDGNVADYLTKTDEWWFNLTHYDRQEVYEEFFSEE